MAKKTIYICTSCLHESAKWLGQCPNCGEWNTFEETLDIQTSKGSKVSKNSTYVVRNIAEVSTGSVERVSSNISEFDRVLGGGFVKGQVILLSGEPGIGKSTILTQLCKEMSDRKILYLAGEENVEQIKIRTNRMSYSGTNLDVISETNVEILDDLMTSKSSEYDLVIVDSIQTIYSSELTGMPGSIGQVRACAQKITNSAKTNQIPVIIIGHVTKDGTLAGPKVLEHVVDTILYLESDSQYLYRILKTTKNRFGPVSEVGVFEMTENGIRNIDNPSELFIGQRLEDSPGSCLTVIVEGQRPLIFEVQALAVKTAFGYPKRTTSGFNNNRLQVLIAVLEKRSGLNLSSYDIYLNIAGGFKISEHAADLAVCLAIASSVRNVAINTKIVAFGEVGLSGEIRRVSNQESRGKEAKKLGYTEVISNDKFKTIDQVIKKVLNSGLKVSQQD